MRVGLIDVDGHNYPNIPLMKLSAYHKAKGDSVEWYYPLLSGHMDIVYVSKVFSFTPDYQYYIDADKVIKGGSGYCIETIDGIEHYNKDKDTPLPPEIEHIYPDYSIYDIKDTAYGFLTRGCPRGCKFCVVGEKEGLASYKVANLSEFWNGQKKIELSDPNFLACKDWKELIKQLIDSKVTVNFNQGLDIRLMTEEKAQYIKQLKVKRLHFAWDNYEDKDKILPKFKLFKDVTKWDRSKLIVYTLTNYNTTIEQDLERIYTLRDLGYWAYVMIYNRDSLPKGHKLRKIQRWVNNRYIFGAVKNFNDYER